MINVACAIIKDGNKVLACQRSHSMHLAGKWEFPGGKLESNETASQCVVREIEEELELIIQIAGRLKPVVCHYPDKSIQLIPFVCKIVSGQIRLKEHENFRWVDSDGILALDWAAADVKLIVANGLGSPGSAV